MRLYEDGVFNTEALKYSIKRLNQLGYFKALEGPGKDVNVDKTPNADNKVDVKMKLEEQNRNQLTFGAGVSQFEGFFGQLSFQTANFLGRGESLTRLAAGRLSARRTTRWRSPSRSCSTATSPAAPTCSSSDVRYVGQFTQKSTGGTLTFGFPVGNGFTRMFTNYSYERVRVTEINAAFTRSARAGAQPVPARFAADRRRRRADHQQSHAEPVVQHGRPADLPDHRHAADAGVDLAGLGGNTNYLKPTLEGIWCSSSRTAACRSAFRGQFEYIRSRIGSTTTCRSSRSCSSAASTASAASTSATIGPSDPNRARARRQQEPAVQRRADHHDCRTGAPDSLLRRRPGARHRRDFAWKEDVTHDRAPPTPLLFDPLGARVTLDDPNVAPHQVISQRLRSAFKTSTGAEIRFFMPVLNVPFRLIFAYNPQRGGVLDNTLQPQKAFQFRFAVGTTF